MRKKLALLMASLFLLVGAVWAQAPVATPEQAITGLLNRIGGNGAADKFEIVIDASLAEDGKDVFVITSKNGKPCIKGNTQLSVATGINWYLNHYAHINLTWNNLTTDLSQVTLPLPGSEEKHVSSAKYRYDFNTCTFSYSMAFWTWDRWQKEIDWMALHGINAPLNLVGLDVVTRKFLRQLGVSDSDINAYIAGPGFIAWFAMNNLEGWGGTINSSSTGVQMNGNPDWWYTRQEQLCRNMLQRMRELGMQPVIPGFSGQVPNCITNYTINGFSAGDVVDNGTWAGGYTRPDILKPNSTSYATFAPIYYKHLHEVMGVSELYSMDPFHEGSLPSGVSNETCYPNIMAKLDAYHDAVDATAKSNYNVDSKAKWIIQYWQGVPQSGAFSAMNSYGDRFIGLDLFADNIYADNAAKWRTDYYKGRPYIYCMLHNFGGRSGLHGRLETTMDGYFEALAKNNNCQGIGATPEGTETNPILYDMLFELPWMNSNPGADAWLEEYAHSRYGVQNEKALSALKNLKKSVWDCKVNQQGTSEAVILARPNWTVGSVSSWSTSAIYWDTQDVLQAADELYAIKDIVTANGGQDGITNYNYDFIDVVRQSMVDYAAQLLPLINAARGNDAEYTRLYQLYLQLMLDLDTMLSYDENFKLERWTSLARNIADEVDGTTENDRNWLEWNARTQVTVWSKGNTDLHDYSNRCWAGLIKDFHYKRWEKFFTTKGGSFDGGWFSGFEYPWTVDFNNTYNLAGDYSKVVIPTDVTATEKAAETFGKYFGRVKSATKNYIFPMGVTTNSTKSGVIPEVYRGKTVELPLIIGKNVTISSVWVDLNNDGAKGNGETLTANNNQVTIPADAAIGKTTAQVVYSDGTDITFSLALVEDITDARTVTAVAGANGSVAIEGTNELSITNTEAVKMTATANTGYNFENWTDAAGNVVSNDNPFIYYGKEDATFTANFIQDKWGVPTEDKSDWSNTTVQTSFVNQITFAYHNREPETIYEASVAPENLFNTIPQIINIPQGASFDISWSDNNDNGLKYCYLSAYYDYDGDGVFELLETKGKRTPELANDGSNNLSVCEGKINVLLPYDAPLGITHMRLRFDGGWKTQNFDASTKAYDAKAQLNRMCYELIINVTEGSAKAAHVVVESNNDAWGTAEVWTDETPGWTASNEWDVSASIPVHIKATKASEDVEFLGWYDQYGRLLTENLEHTMLAREDATYTAKFRKALDIDGWVFEYRTESGSEVTHYSTTALANGVAPTAGKKYYIAAHTKSGGVYYNRYLYDNSGKLATSTSVPANCVWTCIDNGDNTFSFQNESGNYLADSNNSDRYLSIGATAAKYTFDNPTHEGVTLKNAASYNGGKCMVTKADGTEFNRYTNPANDGGWSSDYLFFEGITPDVVILTGVRQSGDHDLDIPETVEILGEQCKIVGFDNGVFNNNKDLWSITMPKSMEFVSSNVVFETSLNGNIAPSTGGDALDSNKSQLIDLGGYALDKNKVWTLNVSFKTEGKNSLYNKWGTILLSGGSNASNNQWFYLSANGNGYLRLPGFGTLYNDQDDNKNFFYEHTNGKIATFTVSIANQGNGNAIVTVINSEGVSKSSSAVAFDAKGFTQLSSYITKGVNITKLEITEGPIPNPFSGCSNLGSIAFSEACANYVAQDGDLYNSSKVLICSPEGKDKAGAIRNLGTLIDNTKKLMDVIATSIDPIGKATALPLTTEQGQDFYVSTNADQNTGGGKTDGAGIAGLVDNNEGTYFHTRWGGTEVKEPHYIQVDLGANNLMNFFKFTYKPRNGSPAPTAMTVYGSNDGVNFTDVLVTINSGLPAHDSGKTYESAAIDSKKYRYLRFTVTGSAGPGNNTFGGQYFFGMLEFDLFKLTSVVEVAEEYKELVGITNDEAANVYDNLVNALYVYNNGGTAEEMQAAYGALEPLYTALNDKENKLEYAREINELVPATEELINAIATSVDPVGKTTEIALSTTEDAKNNYISCNAATANEGVGNLLDNNDGTILHTEWNGGAVSAYQHYLLIELADGEDLSNFKFRYKARTGNANTMNMGDIPSGIKVYGLNEKDGADEELYTVSGLSQTSAYDWTSPAIDAKSYRYLRFNVTANSGFWHMAEFDLFKVASDIEVAPGYKGIGGITNEEAEAAYDNMVKAQALCTTGTATELKDALEALRTSYEALNAKKGTVLNGYYNISWQNGETEVPMFIGYNEENDDWKGEDHKGYKMLGTGVYTTESEADKVFHIVPQENGYSISAQGKNLVAINFNAWNHLQFSDDKNAAGVYNFIEQTDLENVYQIQGVGENDDDWTHNDFLQVYNTDGKMIVGSNSQDVAHNFKLVPATEYTLTVPASGYAAVCLPFNVVLPEGVEAYDINSLEKQKLVSGEVLATLAVAGDIVMAGTPMVVKATAGDHTLGITMESEGAKTSLDGSVLRGNFVKQNLVVNADAKKYMLNEEDVWELLEVGREIPANTCWIEATGIDYDYNIDMTPEFVDIDNWKFRYEYTTHGVKLTDAAVDGNGVLEIPAKVNVDGVSKDVDAISPDFLHGNKTLTSITFPSTLTNLGFRTEEPMFEGNYKGKPGDGGVYNGNVEVSQVGAHRVYPFPIDLSTGESYKVTSASAWRLTLDVTIDKPESNFNNYGSAIVSTNPNSLADSYTGGDFQIYMRAKHKEIIVKVDNADDRYTYVLPEVDEEGVATGDTVVLNHFKFELEYDGTGGYQVVIYYDDGRAKMYSISAADGAKVKEFDKLYYSLPEGISVDVKFDRLISEGLFVGCTNLKEIIVDKGNPTFKSCEHGVLYDKNGYYVMRIPEGDPGDLVNGRKHFEIPSKVVKLYAGSFHGVDADIVLHSNPIIGVVKGHEAAVENAKFFLSLDDIDGTIAVGETGYGGARDFISTNNNKYQSARYKRTPLGEDKYGTICLPFVPENALGKYDFFEFKYGEVNSFVFSQVASVNDLKANTPYLYKLKDKDKRGNMESENGLDVFETSKPFTVETHAKYNPAEEEAGTSRALGTYVNFYIETKNYKDRSAYYYFSTGQQKFLKVTEQLNYRPYRAIFVVNPKDGNTSQAPARISLRLLDGTTTDIDASLVEGMETPVYYDLSGRRVLNPGSGVYIVNGKKVFIK